MIAFRCPHCGIRVQVEERWAGQPVQCGGCRRRVTVPEGNRSSALSAQRSPVPALRGSGTDDTEVDRLLDVLPGDDDKTRVTQRVPRRASRTGSMGALLPFFLGCSLVLGLGAIALGCVGLWWLLRDRPEETTSPVKAASRPSGETKKDDASKDDKKAGNERWTVLFRSSNPAVWNTASDGVDYAIPLNRAPAVIRYLRLRRMDTGEALILPLNRAQLDQVIFPDATRGGYSWNGTAKLDWGGLHLGIAQGIRHKFPAPQGLIIVAYDGVDVWVGSGFGHKCFVNDVQYYCWKGQEIGRTVFEIAVTDQPLTDEEKRVLLPE